MADTPPEPLAGRTFTHRTLRGSRFVDCDLGEVVVRGWDGKAKTAIEAQATQSGGLNQGGLNQTGGLKAQSAFGAAKDVVVDRPVATVDEAKAIAKELRDWVGKEIGPIAKPKDIRFGDNLPKTRSGKIMRRLLRGLARGETAAQDTSTLENPAILEQLKG